MNPELVGILGFVILFALMFIGVPLGWAMALIGFAGAAYIVNFDASLNMIGNVFFGKAASYTFCVFPLFILMGEFAVHSEIMSDAYNTMNKWLSRLPGGLAVATIGGCGIFAAISGSSMANSVTMAKIALPEMEKRGYSQQLSTGAIAAGGTLGVLIPPSMGFVVYAIIAEQSIGKLFLAGILPGILQLVLFALTIIIMCKIKPQLGGPGEKSTWKEKIISLKGLVGIAIVFLMVMGGIWGGVFTPTEAGAVGALAVFIILAIRRKITRKVLSVSFVNSMKTTGMSLAIVMGASVFSYFIALSNIPHHLAQWVGTYSISPALIIISISVLYLIFGCIMDVMGMMLVTLPILLPFAIALNFDLIWFGVVITILGEMALITPPIGLNVLVLSGVLPHVKIETIFKGIFPFFITTLITLIIIILFPQISLLIPGSSS